MAGLVGELRQGEGQHNLFMENKCSPYLLRCIYKLENVYTKLVMRKEHQFSCIQIMLSDLMFSFPSIMDNW